MKSRSGKTCPRCVMAGLFATLANSGVAQVLDTVLHSSASTRVDAAIVVNSHTDGTTPDAAMQNSSDDNLPLALKVTAQADMTSAMKIEKILRSGRISAQTIYDLIRQRELRAATVLAQTAREKYPADIRIWQADINALYAAGLVTQAERETDEAIRRFGADKTLLEMRKKLEQQIDSINTNQQPVTQAWGIAAQAYRDYDDGKYEIAANGATSAVRLAPEKAEYRQLLVYALQAAGRYEEANRAIDEAIARFGEDQRWMTPREDVRQHIGASFAQRVYALGMRNLDESIHYARLAVEYAPDSNQFRDLLIQALLRSRKFSDAESECGNAIRNDIADPVPLVLRAYARQQLGKNDDATSDLDAALNLPDLDETSRRNLLFITIDAALENRDIARASHLLEAPVLQNPESASVEQAVQVRRRAIQAMSFRRERQQVNGFKHYLMAEPILNWLSTPYGDVCELLPGVAAQDAGYPVAATVYEALNQHSYPVAVDKARELVSLIPENLRYRELLIHALILAGKPHEAEIEADRVLAIDPENTKLLVERGRLRKQAGQSALASADFAAALALGEMDAATEIGVLADADRKEDARRRFQLALKNGELTNLSDLELAYLCTRIDEKALAYAAFVRADQAGQLPVSTDSDAAFAALRLKLDSSGIAYLQRTIDAVETGNLQMENQALFDTRRSVSEVSRKYGLIVSLSLRGTGTLGVSGGGQGGGAFTDSSVLGVEAYWRPLGYNDARYVEVFARGFDTLRDKQAGVPVGAESILGAVGARWKPVTDQTLILSVWRQFPFGSSSLADWVTQVAYFTGAGLDLRVDADSWTSWQISPTAGRYIEEKQNYGLLYASLGKSYRVDAISNRFVIQPHAVLAADYNNSLSDTYSIGAGAGIGLRYWFREDKYHAPRSYIDLNMEYRDRIGGDMRAKGPFVTLTTSY